MHAASPLALRGPIPLCGRQGSSAPKPRPGSAPKPRVAAAQKKGNAVAAAGKRRNSGAPGPGRTIVPRKAPFLGAGSSAPPLGLKITIKNDLFRPSGSAPGNRGQARGGKVWKMVARSGDSPGLTTSFYAAPRELWTSGRAALKSRSLCLKALTIAPVGLVAIRASVSTLEN